MTRDEGLLSKHLLSNFTNEIILFNKDLSLLSKGL